MRGVADFVCLLLGFGSVSGMEKTHREKQLNTELTPKEKDGIDHCLAFARQYVIDDRYMPSAHDDLSSWTKKYGLTTIEGINLTSFPSSPDLVIDSFIEGYAQDKVFPDPRVLQNIPALSSYVTTTTDTDGQQQMIIDPNKADELKNKLQDKKVIGQIIDILMQSYDADFWMKFAKIEEGQQTATPIDCIGLLFATSLAPTQSGPAYKAKALDFAKMGMGVTLTTVVWATLASWEQLAPWNAKNPSPEPTWSSVEKSRTPNTEWEAIPSDKYDAAFTTKVLEVCKDLDILDPNWLMQVMDKETWWKFSPSVKNGAWSWATGLIQFMPSTADSLGTTTDELAAMSAVDQLDYVKKYFEPYTWKLTNLASVYMAVFYPAALSDLQSWDMDKVIFTKLDKDGKETKAYRQNKWMDTGNDGTITIQDITNFVSGWWQKEYFKGKESSEIKVQSIDLAENSIKPSETVLFGASNAGTVAWVIEDTSSRKGVHSFPGKNSATLKTEAEKIADWWKQTIITSTVNNGYNTDEKAEQAAKDMQAIAQQALNAWSTPVIVLYPNPSNWSDKTVNPNRYEKFQHYNELMKTWCQDKAWDIKPQILDLSADAYKDKFKRDESGYHVDKNVMKQMFTHYLSQ